MSEITHITPPAHPSIETEVTTIGQRIRAARKTLNLNQESLASRLGVTQPTVANWEADVHNPRQLMLAKLAEALNVTLGWLAGGEAVLQNHTKHAATGYLSRGLYHVPVLPSRILTSRTPLQDGSMDTLAVDYIPMTARSEKMFASFVEPGPYAAVFPGETLFVLDYSRTKPTAGVYGLLATPEGAKLHYWPDGETAVTHSAMGDVLGILMIAIRFF